MKIKAFFLLFLLIIFSFCFFIFKKYECYKFKITFEIDKLSILDVDRYLSSDLRKNLLNLEEIKDVVFVLKDNYCCVYCKIYPFCTQKALNNIQNKIKLLPKWLLDNSIITFESNFDVEYDYFLVLYSDFMTYQSLANACDNIESELLCSKFIKKILKLAKAQKATYLYFDDSILQRYDLTLSDIKNKIEQNNILFSNSKNIFDNKIYINNVNSSINESVDIAKIPINFKNSNYVQKFGDIFKIVDDIETPSKYLINYNDKKAIVLAISSKNIFSKIFLKFKIKKSLKKYQEISPELKCEILKTSQFKTIKIPLENNSNIDYSYQISKKIDKLINENCLYFIGIDCPKYSYNDDFFEIDEHKITILAKKNKIKKIRQILNKNNIKNLNNKKKDLYAKSLNEMEEKIDFYKNWRSFLITKKMIFDYQFNEDLLLRYKITKQDVINSIFASSQGLECFGYNDFNCDYVKIILKNKNEKHYGVVYSKENKNLVLIDSLLIKNLKSAFTSVAYKNNLYFTRLYK